MTSSGQALVEVTGIEKRFGTTRALHDVSLSIKAGQCLGLVGRNGAGKSTLVSILSGLVEPDAGTVAFGGEPAPRVGDTARWHEWIATVFQHSMIVPDLSVAENVFLGSTPAGVPAAPFPRSSHHHDFRQPAGAAGRPAARRSDRCREAVRHHPRAARG